MTILQRDGWWIPESDRVCYDITRSEVGDAMAWLQHVNAKRGWGTIIQAGTNTGIFPARLAGLFERVHTFEPDHDNYECALKNLAGLLQTWPPSSGNVLLEFGALGNTNGPAKVIHHSPGNTGAHRAEPARADEPYTTIMLRIDDVLPEGAPQNHVDVIWLDIEGGEADALIGATKTIQRCHPLILVEEKNLGETFGHNPEDLADNLAVLGYEHVSSHANDRAYRWSGK